KINRSHSYERHSGRTNRSQSTTVHNFLPPSWFASSTSSPYIHTKDTIASSASVKMARISRANAQASAIMDLAPPQSCEATEDHHVQTDPTDLPKRKRGRPRKILESASSPPTSSSSVVALSDDPIMTSDPDSTSAAPVKDNSNDDALTIPILANNRLVRVLKSVSCALPPPAPHLASVAAASQAIPSASATAAHTPAPTTPPPPPTTTASAPTQTKTPATPSTPATAAPNPVSSDLAPAEHVSRSPTVESDWSLDPNFMVARESAECEPMVIEPNPAHVAAIPTISPGFEHPSASTPCSNQSASKCPKKQRSSAIMWHPKMLDALMKSAVKNIREGRRKATGLPRETWASIALDVADASPDSKGKDITWEKCQTKMESLRKKWKLHCRLIKTPGFSKCPITGAVVGPEHLWLEEQKKDPKVREFRINPPTNIAELAIVFDNLREFDLPGPVSLNHAQPSAVFAAPPAPNDNNVTTHNLVSRKKRKDNNNHEPSTPSKRAATKSSPQRNPQAASRSPINRTEPNNPTQATERPGQGPANPQQQQNIQNIQNIPEPNIPQPTIPIPSIPEQLNSPHPNIPPHTIPPQPPQTPYSQGPDIPTNIPQYHTPSQPISHPYGPYPAAQPPYPPHLHPQSSIPYNYPPITPATTSTTQSVLERASRQLLRNFRHRQGWTRMDTVKALEMLEMPGKADVFVGLDGDVEVQEDWLRMVLGRGLGEEV
ncbi:hypothetical protein BZA77DRAFT_15274, partial [Pyronema omphalodes]